MILKELNTQGFDFTKLPEAIQLAINSVDKATKGSFESDNQKLNVLDYYIWEAIKSLNPNNSIVINVGSMYDQNASLINNNSFNTEVTTKPENPVNVDFSDLTSTFEVMPVDPTEAEQITENTEPMASKKETARKDIVCHAEGCEEMFTPIKDEHVFCSDKCRQKQGRKRRAEAKKAEHQKDIVIAKELTVDNLTNANKLAKSKDLEAGWTLRVNPIPGTQGDPEISIIERFELDPDNNLIVIANLGGNQKRYNISELQNRGHKAYPNEDIYVYRRFDNPDKTAQEDCIYQKQIKGSSDWTDISKSDFEAFATSENTVTGWKETAAVKESAYPDFLDPETYANDIDYELARNSYRASSFSPDKRAKSEIESWKQSMAEQYRILLDFAKRKDYSIPALDASYSNYRKKMLDLKKDMLHKRSRTMSSMITGPANFPVESNRKKLGYYHSALEKYLEYDKRAIERIKNDIDPIILIREGDPDAIEALENKLQSMEKIKQIQKEFNKAFKGQESTPDERRDYIVNSGILGHLNQAYPNEEWSIESWKLKGAMEGGQLSPKMYLTRHMNELRKRIQGEKNRAEFVDRLEPFKFDGGVIEFNKADNRIQIFYDEKPDVEERSRIKKAAFKWSPKAGAWQRQMTVNALAATFKLFNIPKLKPEPAPEPEPAPVKTTYIIDGKQYDLSELMLPEDHPIMILDPDSPQWKSAVKEYFEEEAQKAESTDESNAERLQKINSLWNDIDKEFVEQKLHQKTLKVPTEANADEFIADFNRTDYNIRYAVKKHKLEPNKIEITRKYGSDILTDRDPDPDEAADPQRRDIAKTLGKEIKIKMPNGEVRKGQFALVELDDMLASHDENTFATSEGYPVNEQGENINDRNYTDDVNAQQKVVEVARELDPDRLVVTSRTPDGTPIIDANGYVVSGNNRTMSMKLARAQFPSTFNKYGEFLEEEIEAFGLTKADLDQYHDPVIVRIDYEIPALNTLELSKYNKPEQKSERPIDKAIKLGKLVDDNELCKTTIGDIVGRYETFSNFYSNYSDQKAMLDSLVNCNIITTQEKAQYFYERGFTEQGKELIENLLAGMVLSKAALTIANDKARNFRAIIITSLPVLTLNNSFSAAERLRDPLNEAIEIEGQIRSTKLDFGNWINQLSLFDKPPTRKGLYLNRLLATGRNNFKKSIEGYNESVQQNQGPSLFGEKPAPDEIFEAYVVNKVAPEDKQIIESTMAKFEADDVDETELKLKIAEEQKTRLRLLALELELDE